MTINRFLDSESELTAFLIAWEAGALPKAECTHAAHVAAAACYVRDHSTSVDLPPAARAHPGL